MAMFTPEELEELERADAQIDAEYRLTDEEVRRSRELDRSAKLDRKDHRGRRAAARQAAYYEAHREEIAAKQAAYREAHREEYNAYMREYMRKRNAALRA